MAMAAGRPLREEDIFDGHSMGQLVRKIIEEAHAAGDCVIVGRGGQCILEHKPDVFHVFVYAKLHDRMRRLKSTARTGRRYCAAHPHGGYRARKVSAGDFRQELVRSSPV